MKLSTVISIAEGASAMLGFPCTKETLTDAERKVLKKLAVAYGQRASQMSDEELIELYNSIDISALKADLDDEDSGADGTGEGTSDADAESEGESEPSDTSEGESDAEGTGNEPDVDEFQPTNALEKSIVEIIKKVHPSLEHDESLDVDKIKDLINEHGTSTVTVELKKPSGEIIKDDSLKHEKLPTVLKALLRGDNVLLVGGAGSGRPLWLHSYRACSVKRLSKRIMPSACPVLCSKLTK